LPFNVYFKTPRIVDPDGISVLVPLHFLELDGWSAPKVMDRQRRFQLLDPHDKLLGNRRLKGVLLVFPVCVKILDILIEECDLQILTPRLK
jgi:hypothetical protein